VWIASSLSLLAMTSSSSFAARSAIAPSDKASSSEPVCRQTRELLEAVGQLDIDFKCRNTVASVHLHHDLVRIERHVARDHRKNLFAKDVDQIGLAEHPTFMREQYLQPLPGNRRGYSAAAKQPHQVQTHAALRPSSRFISPLR